LGRKIGVSEVSYNTIKNFSDKKEDKVGNKI
jgi:hypothetical protein